MRKILSKSIVNNFCNEIEIIFNHTTALYFYYSRTYFFFVKHTVLIFCASGVAHILTEEGEISELPVILAALLHDTVEDTDTTFEEIASEFGEKVADIVRECSDDKNLPSAERKRLQILHAKNSSHEAKLVKLADKLYNLRDLDNEIPVGWTKERVVEYFNWAYKVVEGLKGTNTEIEKKLNEIFVKHKITDSSVG